MPGRESPATRHELRALGLGGLAVLLWSTVATAFKLGLGGLSPLALLAVASTVAVLVLLTLAAVRGQLAQLARMDARAWSEGFGLGLLNPLLYYVLLFEAYDRLPAQIAQPLNYTWAITLTLLSIPILGQRVRPRQWVAIAISYAGVVVIATRGGLGGIKSFDPVGVLLALLSTVVWALYWLLHTRRRTDPVLGPLPGFLLASAVLVGFVELTEGWRWPQTTAGIAAVWTGVFEMGITFPLWLMALQATGSAARVSSLIFFSPFLSLVFIHLVLGEQIYVSTLFGLVLIVFGSVLQARPAE